MDYDSSLKYLQNLLTNKQAMQSNQFNQGLGFEQSVLGQKGQQFDATLALQKVIADWQNQLANKAQAQSEQAQKFSQDQTIYNQNPAVLANNANLARNASPAGIAADKSFMDDFLARIRGVQSGSPTETTGASFGAPLTQFASYPSGLLSLGLGVRGTAPTAQDDEGSISAMLKQLLAQPKRQPGAF